MHEFFQSLFWGGLITWVVYKLIKDAIKRHREEQAERRQREWEAQRQEETRQRLCRATVEEYQATFAYLGRLVFDPVAIDAKIGSGATVEEFRAWLDTLVLAVDGVSLGVHLTKAPVVLPQRLRNRHVYVVGKSGYGKTTLLQRMILQDLARGHGVGILAPEMEMLTEEILPFVPASRVRDVIYFNPRDVDCPVVLNPLHLEPGADLDLQVDETFTVLQQVIGEGGPRMDEILRHTLYALTERAGSTLLDIEPLLDRTDGALRQEVVRTTQDEMTRRFFGHTYLQFPKEAHFPIINRISRIIRGRYVRSCLCPPAETPLTPAEVSRRLLNVRRAMDEGKVLLFNLSDGILGAVASQLIGQLIVAKFQTATMSRADQQKAARRPFYLYLDEFQNFCGVAQRSYEKILSRARKYNLGLVLAHQQTHQIPNELYREILGNVTTIVSFQVAQADAGRLGQELLVPLDGELKPLSKDKLLKLGVGKTWCRIGTTTFRMNVVKADEVPDVERARQVIQASQAVYGIPRGSRPEQPQAGFGPSADDPLADLDPDEVF